VNTATALDLAAGRSPRRLAVVEGDRQLTYAELTGQVRAVAWGLARAGVGSGDSVVLAVANSLEATVAVLAVQVAGAVAVPVNFRSRGGALYSALRAAAASVIIVDEQAAAAIEELADGERPPIVLTVNGARCASGVPLGALAEQAAPAPLPTVSGDAPAIALLTSGSTGTPKLIRLTHRESLARVYGLFMNHGFRHDDGMRSLGLMPIYHTVGLHAVLLLSLLANGTYFPVKEFVPAQVLDLIARERITYVFGAPTMFARMLDADPGDGADRFASVRDAMYAGAPMDHEMVRQVSARLTRNLTHIYGNTETYNSLFYRFAGSCPGALSRGVLHQVRIVRIGGSPFDEARRGEEGELIVDMASPEAFDGYAEPEQTARRVRDGWYYTGDVAVEDDEGRIFIRGRTEDMIISGGENIYPADVENVLGRHPGVRECAVVGVPDPVWGQVVAALVIPSSPAVTEAEISIFCREQPDLDSFKRPRQVLFVHDLPVTPSGKRSVSALRDLAVKAMGGSDGLST